MTKYAHIIDGRVHWIAPPDQGPELFQPGFLVPVPEATQQDDIELSPGVYGVPVSEPSTPEQRVAEINAEAQRRILAILPEWKQRNLTVRSVELLRIGPPNWSPAEQAEADAIQAQWDRIKAIRDASDVAIESGKEPAWPT